MRPGRLIAAIAVIALCIPGLISGEAQAAPSLSIATAKRVIDREQHEWWGTKSEVGFGVPHACGRRSPRRVFCKMRIVLDLENGDWLETVWWATRELDGSVHVGMGNSEMEVAVPTSGWTVDE